MTYKNQSQLTDLRVKMDDPNGKEFWIPSKGGAASMAQLITLVTQQMTSFDTKGSKFTQAIQMQADLNKMSLRAFVAKVIENQICMRHPGDCHSDGLGDRIHFASGKIDDVINKLPKGPRRLARRIVKRITKAATGESSHTLRGCKTCGGTKSISSTSSNLGRADRLNRITKRYIG